MDKITKYFLDYLKQSGISHKTYKNYASDINHFNHWLLTRVTSFGSSPTTFTDTIPFITPQTGQEYKNFLIHNHVPLLTINRRLSTLRHLGRYLFLNDTLNFNFSHNLVNLKRNNPSPLKSLTRRFEKDLKAEGISAITIKNYLSDIKHFTNWLENNSTSQVSTGSG